MADAATTEKSRFEVTENEGVVLSLISRTQPVTRYRLFKAFEQSPTTSLNTSKGTLYPLIARMAARGFVEGKPGTGGHGSDELSLTESGYRALNQWLMQTGPEHAISHDALLSRVMSLGQMPRDERIRWIAEAKALLLANKAQLKGYYEGVDAPYVEFVHGSAIAMIDAKLEWLDRLLIQVVKED